MKKVSIKDIAKKTSLSTTTVSRVMNGKAKEYRISENSQNLVLKAAKKLNYKANYAASNLRSGKNNTIAVLVPSLVNPFFASMASEIIQDLRKENYIAILSESSESLENEKEILKSLYSRNIEGLIIVPAGDQFDHIAEMKDQGLPIVCIDRYFDDLDIPYVSTDNYIGAYNATKYLIEYGHSNILAIQGVHHSVPNKQRVKGFKKAMKDGGHLNHKIVGDAFSIQNGYLETKLVLQNKDRPTAIFAFSNTIALGCMKALKEEKISVPSDISLITFDDNPYLDFLYTPLSCVIQPELDIAKLAIKFLFSIINKEQMETPKMLLEPELRIRNSIRRLNDLEN